MPENRCFKAVKAESRADRAEMKAMSKASVRKEKEKEEHDARIAEAETGKAEAEKRIEDAKNSRGK